MLWHILLYLFGYDFTLEEGNVEATDDTNQQVGVSLPRPLINNL